MRSVSAYLLLSLMAMLQFACKKSDQPNPSQHTGKVTPVGVPTGGPKAEKVIGTAGGSITSNDGRIKVDIPAGALAADMTISIESITNNNPMGLGEAYRLLPHGVRFAKDVTITFAYTEADISHTIPEALGIAYQDEAGVWQAIGGPVLDKAAGTVSVKSRHFSDWSFFESFRLELSAAALPVNGTASLQVVSDADILAPLTENNERPIGEATTMTATFVKQWTLTGAGKLQGNGATGTYTAPSTVPSSPNPVAVSVSIDLNKKGKFLVLAHIAIVPDDGEIEIRVNGGPWVKKTASVAVKMGEDLYAIADSDGDVQGSYVLINFTGAVGTQPFRSPKSNSGTYVHYLIDGGNNYVCYHIVDDEMVSSGGGVTITSMGEGDQFVKGSFSATEAGYADLKPTAHVEGRFRVRKSW